MKALIISDTHGRRNEVDIVLQRVGKIDMLFHLGDANGDEEYIRQACGCETHIISGNNDYRSELNAEETVLVGNHKIWMVHGHKQLVGCTLRYLYDETRDMGMDIVMFGHTHMPVIEELDGIYMVNPGSLSYPRQENGRGSYIIMEIDFEEKVKFTIDYL